MSNTVTVSGGGAPTISASPASATPGQPVTVSWSGVSSVTDWVGLHSAGSGDSSGVDWKYTSSCTFAAGGSVVASGSCIFTMPSTPGPYEFRLFANNTLTRLAVSNTVTVSGGGAPTISASPASANPGQPVTVSWSGVSSVTDWVGLYSAGSDDSSGVDWKYTSSCGSAAGGSVLASGSCIFTMPDTPGSYEFRLFANNSLTRLAVSNTVTVSGGGGATISASPGSGGPGQPVTVSWTGVSSVTDWIGLYNVASGDSVGWKYTSSCTLAAGGSVVSSGSCIFPMPGAGTYQFRLFANNTSTELAVSNTVTVSGAPAPTLTGSPNLVGPGQTVTVSWSGSSSPTDWVGLYSLAAENGSHSGWLYVSSCTQAPESVRPSGSCFFTMPGTPGTYHFRLFSSNGFTLLAVSNDVTVP